MRKKKTLPDTAEENGLCCTYVKNALSSLLHLLAQHASFRLSREILPHTVFSSFQNQQHGFAVRSRGEVANSQHCHTVDSRS
jgi:hypothetical protein